MNPDIQKPKGLRHLIRGPITAVLSIAMLLLLAGCNDRVFVDPLPEIAPISLPPTGGHADIDLGVEGAIYMSVYTDRAFNGTVYEIDGDGKATFSSNPGVYLPGGLAISSTGSLDVELKITATTDGHVSVNLSRCYSVTPSSLWIVIHYPYGSVEIPLQVEAIEPFSATDITYPAGFVTLADTDITEGYSIVVENMSQDTLSTVITPFHDAKASVFFRPDSSREIPMSTDPPALPLPSWGANGAGLYDFSAPYLPEKTLTVNATGLPDTRVRVKVPPMTRRRYVCFIERKVITASYLLTLSSPSLPVSFASAGTVRIAYPFDYVIGYNDL